MASDRVAAVLKDIDSAGEGLIIGLYVQSSLSSVQRVLLDEIHVLHSCYLNTESCVIITTNYLLLISFNSLKLKVHLKMIMKYLL